MARATKILQSLNAGELSPLLDARIDQDKYQMGCRTLENFYPLIYGGAERRPGSYFVGEAKDSTVKCRVMEFIFSVDQAYIMEFGNQYIRVYANSGRFVSKLKASISAWVTATTYYAGDFVTGADTDIYRCLIGHDSTDAGGDGTGGDPDSDGNPIQWENSTDTSGAITSDAYPIYELSTPYLTADLYQLKFEQSADVMYITHKSYEPRKLVRLNATTFILSELGFSTGPFQDLNDVSTARITPSATTGSITLTASGTNKDGTAFQPFKTGTTAGHSPSGATGDSNAGTPQTLKSITGALFKIVHSMEAGEINYSFSGPASSDSLLVYKGVSWDFVTKGTWTGTIKLERSYDDIVWETIATVVSENNNNAQLDGTEEVDDAFYRVTATDLTSGSSNGQFLVRDSSHIGLTEITAVASGTSATATVIQTLGSTDATHRWAEGYWSNFRGWPNAVAISAEERLTFAGSASFPLTVWGSKSGDFTDMTAGILDDDAIVFTLVGSGSQNTIRWIVSKNTLILGTYGGEHVLGSSNENEAMTPTNVRAEIQSTYGSEDVQAMLVGNAILFVQRGGRRIREMVFKFEKGKKGEFDAENLTVFAEHITESTINDMAYQRTPDPAVICIRNDGQIAYLSYERSQDVWSWSRLITSTSAGDSVYESTAVIPSGGEEDQIYYSVKRVINGNTVRMIEYFAPRGF